MSHPDIMDNYGFGIIGMGGLLVGLGGTLTWIQCGYCLSCMVCDIMLHMRNAMWIHCYICWLCKCCCLIAGIAIGGLLLVLVLLWCTPSCPPKKEGKH